MADLSIQRVRHPLRFRALQVSQVQRLAPHLVRVTLAGDALDGFTSLGFDDHVKLFFPDPDTGVLVAPQAGPEGPVWPEGQRPLMRDYTPRYYDPVARTLAIDFALHEPAGPATRWAQQARVGQTLGVGGPRGSMVVPAGFDWHLLVGDATALPAMARRLEELPAGARAEVLVEVDSAADQIALPSAAAVRVQWVVRSPGVAHPLLEALRSTPLPAGVFFAWLACESAQAKVLRAHLVTECRANPQWVKASAYWRRGVADAHESLDR